MRPVESPSAAPRARGADPGLEATLVASGWTLDEIASPVSSPLANLRPMDLDATVGVAAPPSGGGMAAGAGGPGRAAGDPNATRQASDQAWFAALAALSSADMHATLVTPAAPRRAAPSAPDELERTRVAPRWSLTAPKAAESPVAAPGAPAPAQSPARSAPKAPALPPVPERPTLAPGVQLFGVMQDSGFVERQWLAQRGQTFLQLSELLYRVLEQVNGERRIDEIAGLVAAETGRPVSANNVRLLIAARLLPLGLITPVAGAEPARAEGQGPRSPLQITFRLGFMGPRFIEPFARALQWLFWPPVLVPLLLLIAAGHAWLYFRHGLLPVAQATLAHPLQMLFVEVLVFVSAVFHEFGHASALRYGGGRARGMGFGFYLVDPAFYTDCTDSYRLGRWGRLRTDLGGVYFDGITALGLFAAYFATGQELLLAAVLILNLEMIEQFSPVFRFDGYWALADLVGVPDFFVLIRPVVRGVLPARWRARRPAAGGLAQAELPALKGWVKAAFLAYVIVVVPALVVSLVYLLALVPAFLSFFGFSAAQQAQLALAAQHGGNPLGLALAGGQMIILVFAGVMISYSIFNLCRSLIRGLWRWGRASRRRRILSLLAIAGFLALLAALWTPQAINLSHALAPHAR